MIFELRVRTYPMRLRFDCERFVRARSISDEGRKGLVVRGWLSWVLYVLPAKERVREGNAHRVGL